MSDAELLLTDEFAQFSVEIAKIHEERKKKKEDFKALYDAFQAEMKDLESQAQEVADNWEAWKASKKA